MKIIQIFDEDHLDYCMYGRPDGPDDFYTECDCYDELQEIKKEFPNDQ